MSMSGNWRWYITIIFNIYIIFSSTSFQFLSTNFHIELQGLSVSLRHEGREPAVSGSTVVPDSSLPMNVPYFDVGAGWWRYLTSSPCPISAAHIPAVSPSFSLTLTSNIMTIGKPAGGVLPTLRRQFKDMSRSQVMAGDSTSASDDTLHLYCIRIYFVIISCFIRLPAVRGPPRSSAKVQVNYPDNRISDAFQAVLLH